MNAMMHERRPLIHATPRPNEELRRPITCYAELLATMKGYRRSQSKPQLAVDFAGGLQDGYVGKLELDIRRAVNESWWQWLGALRLVMILVPAADAIRTDKCPCCGVVKSS